MMKASFENTTAMGLIDDIRAFLAIVDGDGEADAAEAATGGATGSKPKRKTKAEKEAEAQAAAAAAAHAATGAAQPTFTPPATQGAQQQPQGFGGAPTTGAAFGSQAGAAFGGAGQQTNAVELHPLAKQINDVIDKSIAGGQPAANVVAFFQSVIGADAANATVDQIKQVFIPRLPEATLKQIAPQLGIAV